jgi:hypothetical protein
MTNDRIQTGKGHGSMNKCTTILSMLACVFLLSSGRAEACTLCVSNNLCWLIPFLKIWGIVFVLWCIPALVLAIAGWICHAKVPLSICKRPIYYMLGCIVAFFCGLLGLLLAAAVIPSWLCGLHRSHKAIYEMKEDAPLRKPLLIFQWTTYSVLCVTMVYGIATAHSINRAVAELDQFPTCAYASRVLVAHGEDSLPPLIAIIDEKDTNGYNSQLKIQGAMYVMEQVHSSKAAPSLARFLEKPGVYKGDFDTDTLNLELEAARIIATLDKTLAAKAIQTKIEEMKRSRDFAESKRSYRLQLLKGYLAGKGLETPASRFPFYTN